MARQSIQSAHFATVSGSGRHPKPLTPTIRVDARDHELHDRDETLRSHLRQRLHVVREQNVDEREDRLLQLLPLLRLTRFSQRNLHLVARHLQHQRHARLQRAQQTVVVVQLEHAERDVLPR